jgi:transketolase
MLSRALEAAAVLKPLGIRCRIIHFHTIKPFDGETLLAHAAMARAVLTLEEHTLIGGLGSVVAETVADRGLGVPVRRLGIPDVFPDEYGSQNSLMERFGLGVPAIVAEARRLLEPNHVGR